MGTNGGSVVLRLRLGGALTALVVALVTANGDSEQMAGTTAAAEAGMAQGYCGSRGWERK